MKDSAFIELLNLYLDHEISAADAAKLETEVLNNPARRRVYQDYCRMQKACKVLAKDFADENAPAAARKVVAFETARPASRAGWYAGAAAAAAAACVAFVFVGGNRGEKVAPKSEVALEMKGTIPANTVVAADRTIPRTVTVPADRDEPQAVLVNALSLAGNKQATTPSLFVTANQEAPQFEWMNTLQIRPMQPTSLDEFRFDGRAPLRNDKRTYVKRLPGEAPMEWNAIQWQK